MRESAVAFGSDVATRWWALIPGCAGGALWVLASLGVNVGLDVTPEQTLVLFVLGLLLVAFLAYHDARTKAAAPASPLIGHIEKVDAIYVTLQIPGGQPVSIASNLAYIAPNLEGPLFPHGTIFPKTLDAGVSFSGSLTAQVTKADGTKEPPVEL